MSGHVRHRDASIVLIPDRNEIAPSQHLSILPSLELAARRLRQGARPQQEHAARSDAMVANHRLAQRIEVEVSVAAQARAGKLCQNDQGFAVVLPRADGGNARLADPWQRPLNRPFDVLGSMLDTADDDEVLETTTDEKFTVADESDVAGLQEGATAVCRELSEARRRLLGAVPIAG